MLGPGIDLGDLGGNRRINVAGVLELRLIDFGPQSRLQLPVEMRSRIGRDEIVAALAAQQLCFSQIVAVEHIIDDLDVRLFSELFDRLCAEIVGPRVEPDFG